MSAVHDDAAREVMPTRRTPGWLTYTIAIVFGLFFAYGVWNAIGNLIQAVTSLAEQGVNLTPTGWVVWIVAIVMPIVIFTVAFFLGRRRPVLIYVLIMAAGLALEAVFWVNVVAYTWRNTPLLVA